MKAKIISLLQYSFLAAVIFLGSCKKILQPDIKGQIALENLVTTESGMITVVNGTYAPLRSLYNGSMQRLTDQASDDSWTWRKEQEPDFFNATPTYNITSGVWSTAYAGIGRANIVISNIDKVTNFSSGAMKNSILGQALFMRAYYYFTLVRLYGGVPLLVHEVKSRLDAELPRSTIPEAYAQIKSDLDSAILLLPASYNGSFGMEKGRPTTYSASALKALVHLELGEWQDAAKYAGDVIDSHKFNLLSTYAANFNGTSENGAGSLFEVQYSGTNPATSCLLSSFYAPSQYQGSATLLPTDESLNGGGGGPSSGNSFVQAVENGDQRNAVIIATYGFPNFIDATKPAGTLYLVNKYYNAAEAVGKSSWNFPLIRYAEMLLTRAEALNELGYVADGEAFNLLNQIRQKAGLNALTSADLPDQETFRQSVRHERRIELAFECKRYFDLNRWGILASAIQQQLNYVNATFPTQRTITHPITGKQYYLYPIPASEFVNNAQLGEQNPGY
jgi:hypothetical protein